MQKTLNQLPQTKQAELKKVVSIIQEKCSDVEMIILYGSYARGDYKEAEDLDTDRTSGHVSDYDILIVTKEKESALQSRLWREISDICYDQKIEVSVRIIARDIVDLNIQLAEDQYFFREVKDEGIILYNSENFELADVRELKLEEKARIAQDHFDYWFKRANMFFDDYKTNFEKGKKDSDYFKLSAFHLHQTAEACYKTILLVFANESPHEHFLVMLRRAAVDQFHPTDKVLRYRTEEEDRLFKLLDYAYIGARYDPEYQIEQEELEILAKEIEKLLEITQVGCEWKIENIPS